MRCSFPHRLPCLPHQVCSIPPQPATLNSDLASTLRAMDDGESPLSQLASRSADAELFTKPKPAFLAAVPASLGCYVRSFAHFSTFFHGKGGLVFDCSVISRRLMKATLVESLVEMFGTPSRTYFVLFFGEASPETGNWRCRALPGRPLAESSVSLQEVLDRWKCRPHRKEPIKLVIVVPAGGQTDSTMRQLAENARKILGHPVVDEQKPGGTGTFPDQQPQLPPAQGCSVRQVPPRLWRARSPPESTLCTV